VPSCGVLVEFIGLPGSGKSTIAHALADLLRLRGALVREPTWRHDHQYRHASRAVRKAALALAAPLSDPFRAARVLAWIAESRQPTPREAFKLAMSCLYLIETTRRCVRTRGVHVCDQGLLQQMWSVLYRATAEWEEHRGLDSPLASAGALANVVVVHAPLATLQCRLARRVEGASRLERQLRGADAPAAMKRAVAAQERVEGVAQSLAARGAVRLLRVSGGGERSPRQTAQAVLDWLTPELMEES
jgi:predicted kinase